MKTVKNAVGREIPLELDNRTLVPYKGAFGHRPPASYIGAPTGWIKPGEKKLLDSIEDAIKKCKLQDGMTISFNHHLRNGDFVVNNVLDIISDMGIKNLRLAPSALFPVHEPLIEHIKNGVIDRIEGSMNGPVGNFVSHGGLPHPAILRSHGARVRAIRVGEIPIDLAFIAAPAADSYGNANGVLGKNVCGSLGYSMVDMVLARKSIVITDNLVPYPCIPMSIKQQYVDYVVEVDSIGDNMKIVSGTTKVTTDPNRLGIAESAANVIKYSGVYRDGMSYQAGAGGISLATTKMLGEFLEEDKYCCRFIDGGVTQHVVDILEKGLCKYILDGQSFDVSSVESLLNNPKHIEISPDFYANIHNKGCLVNVLDSAVLGATEVDVDFNVNVNTHSDGRLLHGIGGHQDVCAGSDLTIITCPVYRKTNPIVMDSVTTITTPGEVVDVIVTDHGVAVNPKRKDLLNNLKDSPVNLITIDELRDIAYDATGGKQELHVKDDIICLIQWRDGTVIDTVRQVEDE